MESQLDAGRAGRVILARAGRLCSAAWHDLQLRGTLVRDVDDQGPAMRMWRVAGVVCLAVMVSAHVGSPDVFYSGRVGGYDLRVIVRPPEVVPGVALVTVHAPADVRRVSIRPVFWRAGTRGAPPADEMRRVDSTSFEGS